MSEGGVGHQRRLSLILLSVVPCVRIDIWGPQAWPDPRRQLLTGKSNRSRGSMTGIYAVAGGSASVTETRHGRANGGPDLGMEWQASSETAIGGARRVSFRVLRPPARARTRVCECRGEWSAADDPSLCQSIELKMESPRSVLTCICRRQVGRSQTRWQQAHKLEPLPQRLLPNLGKVPFI